MSEMPSEVEIPEWSLGDRLRRSLRKVGMREHEMAELLGVSPTTVGNYTSERTAIKAGALRVWAMRCGVPYEWLKNGDAGTGEGPPPPGTPLPVPTHPVNAGSWADNDLLHVTAA